jgi:hypothetical protein
MATRVALTTAISRWVKTAKPKSNELIERWRWVQHTISSSTLKDNQKIYGNW